MDDGMLFSPKLQIYYCEYLNSRRLWQTAHHSPPFSPKPIRLEINSYLSSSLYVRAAVSPANPLKIEPCTSSLVTERRRRHHWWKPGSDLGGEIKRNVGSRERKKESVKEKEQQQQARLTAAEFLWQAVGRGRHQALYWTASAANELLQVCWSHQVHISSQQGGKKAAWREAFTRRATGSCSLAAAAAAAVVGLIRFLSHRLLFFSSHLTFPASYSSSSSSSSSSRLAEVSVRVCLCRSIPPAALTWLRDGWRREDTRRWLLVEGVTAGRFAFKSILSGLPGWFFFPGFGGFSPFFFGPISQISGHMSSSVFPAEICFLRPGPSHRLSFSWT